MSGGREFIGSPGAPDAALEADPKLAPRRRTVTVEVRKRRAIRKSYLSKEALDQSEVSVGELVQRCHALIDACALRSRLPDQIKLEVLSIAIRVWTMSHYNEHHRSDLEAQFKINQVRDSKRTDIYTRLVKLLFRNDDKRSEVNRLANTLRSAAVRGIQPINLPEFVKGRGGIVECSRSYAASYSAYTKKNTNKAGEMRSDIVDCLRQGEEITLDLGWAPEAPFSVVLVPKGESRFSLVCWRQVSQREIQKIANSFARNSAKADWLRPGYSAPGQPDEIRRATLHLPTRK